MWTLKTKKHPIGCMVYGLGFEQVLGGTLRRYFFEHRGRYRKNYLTRDFGRPQSLTRLCDCAGEHFLPMAKNSSPLILLLRPKQKSTRLGAFCFGGEGGIRTLEPLLMVTRFPIVRARPTTRLLRISRRLLYILFGKKSSVFLIFSIHFF